MVCFLDSKYPLLLILGQQKGEIKVKLIRRWCFYPDIIQTSPPSSSRASLNHNTRISERIESFVSDRVLVVQSRQYRDQLSWPGPPYQVSRGPIVWLSRPWQVWHSCHDLTPIVTLSRRVTNHVTWAEDVTICMWRVANQRTSWHPDLRSPEDDSVRNIQRESGL